MPYFLWIQCRCGHAGETQISSLDDSDREAVLRRARCFRCGTRSAVDMRRGYKPELTSMDGAEQGGPGTRTGPDYRA